MNKNTKSVYKPLANGKGFCYNYNCIENVIEVRSRRRAWSRRAVNCLEAIFAELYKRARLYGGYMVNSHITVCHQMAGALFLYD